MYGVFLPNLNIVCPLKSKIKNCFHETVFWTPLNNEKIIINRVIFVDKGSGSVFFSPKRPDPTGSGSATLLLTNVF